jgi:hypothetical protein
MPEVISVEFDHQHQLYVAILTDGSQVFLESDNLRQAELEAERIADQLSFESFSSPGLPNMRRP